MAVKVEITELGEKAFSNSRLSSSIMVIILTSWDPLFGVSSVHNVCFYLKWVFHIAVVCIGDFQFAAKK